jgi:hypothetical protein
MDFDYEPCGEDYEPYGDQEYREFQRYFEDKTYLQLCIEQPLNTIISTEESIILFDKRDDMYEYSSLPTLEKNKYNNYLHIKSIRRKPITLKDILTKMIDSEYYSKDNTFQHEYLDHIFLECIEQKNPNTIQYELFLGS